MSFDDGRILQGTWQAVARLAMLLHRLRAGRLELS